MEIQQITRIPIKYWPILNRLSNESVGKIFKNILLMEENLNDEEKIYYDLIMIDIIAINKKAWFWSKWWASGVKWKEYGKQWWRPKVKKTNPPKGGLNNPPNIIKDNIIKDKKDIKEILSDEEYIISNNNQLYVIWIMISYGLIVRKDKKEIEDLVNWVTVLWNDYLDRTEWWSLDRETGKRYINQRYDYVVWLPKKQTNIKNSVRNSFILYSGKRWKK